MTTQYKKDEIRLSDGPEGSHHSLELGSSPTLLPSTTSSTTNKRVTTQYLAVSQNGSTTNRSTPLSNEATTQRQNKRMSIRTEAMEEIPAPKKKSALQHLETWIKKNLFGVGEDIIQKPTMGQIATYKEDWKAFSDEQIKSMFQDLVPADRKIKYLRVYNNAFYGDEAISNLCSELGINRSRALVLAQRCLAANLFKPLNVTSKRLRFKDAHILYQYTPPKIILNHHDILDLTHHVISESIDIRRKKEFVDMFQFLDENDEGEIPIQKLEKVMILMGNFRTTKQKEELHKMLRAMDEDGSRTINFFEYRNFMARQMTETVSESELLDAFRIFDTNGNGQLTQEQIFEITTNFGELAENEDIKLLLQEFPKTKKGQIAYKDLVSVCLDS